MTASQSCASARWKAQVDSTRADTTKKEQPDSAVDSAMAVTEKPDVVEDTVAADSVKEEVVPEKPAKGVDEIDDFIQNAKDLFIAGKQDEAEKLLLTRQKELRAETVRFEAGSADFQKIVKVLIDSYHLLGNMYVDQKEYGKAEKEFKRITKMDSTFYKAFGDLGEVYFLTEKYEKALEYFEMAAKLNPEDPLYPDYLNFTKGSMAYDDGLTSFNLTMYDQAIKQFKASLPFLKNEKTLNYKVHAFLGRAYFETLKFKEAEAEYEESLKLNRSYPEIYAHIGFLELARNEFNGAIKSFQKAIQMYNKKKDLQPETEARLLNNIGFVYFLMGNNYSTQKKNVLAVTYYKESKKHYELSLNRQPSYEEAKGNLSHVDKILSGERNAVAVSLFQDAAKEIDAEKQVEIYRKILKKDPTYEDALVNIGVSYYFSGKIDSAIQSMETALRINKYLPQAHNNLGFVYSKLGKHDKAIKHLYRAIQLKKDYKAAYENIAFAYLGKKEYDKARKIWEQLLVIFPNDPDALLGLNQINKAQDGSGQ